MLPLNNRALKEWAVVCEAMGDGLQTVLVRKGGIREEDGVFSVEDREFFLLPTYEHQNEKLLQVPYVRNLRTTAPAGEPGIIRIDSYAVVDAISTADSEATVNSLRGEFIWNAEYVRMRFDYNPYDPVYAILLRVYRLRETISLPLLPEYDGCKSWVTLDRELSTEGAVPAVPDVEYLRRRGAILELLRENRLGHRSG